jgi:hypothetical protein
MRKGLFLIGGLCHANQLHSNAIWRKSLHLRDNMCPVPEAISVPTMRTQEIDTVCESSECGTPLVLLHGGRGRDIPTRKRDTPTGRLHIVMYTESIAHIAAEASDPVLLPGIPFAL